MRPGTGAGGRVLRAFPGYLTEIAYYPRHRLAVAVQVNSSARGALGRPLSTLVDELAAAALGEPTFESRPHARRSPS